MQLTNMLTSAHVDYWKKLGSP